MNFDPGLHFLLKNFWPNIVVCCLEVCDYLEEEGKNIILNKKKEKASVVIIPNGPLHTRKRGLSQRNQRHALAINQKQKRNNIGD